MRSDCIEAVTEAAKKAGRVLTAGDFRDIEGRILNAARLNARENRAQTQAQSPTERLQAAAERVAQDIIAEKTRAAVNVARQVVATDRNLAFIERYGKTVGGSLNALRRLMADNQDRKTNVRTLESRRNGIVRPALGKLDAVRQATERFAGFWTDRNSVRDVLRELYGQNTGNAPAKAAAKAFQDVAESLRNQFNDAGGAIRKLRDWAVPQSHSQLKVAKVAFQEWEADVLPRLDRDAYVNTDGSLMSDAQLHEMLLHAYTSISTDGANQIVPGQAHGAGALKNRGQDSRALHFKDADAYLDYQAKYGERSLLETMAQHVQQMGKRIATLETFGPNAEAGFQFLADTAYQKDATGGRMKLADAQSLRAQIETQFAISSGKAGAMADPVLAHRFDTARAIMILPKLGGATLSAITDGANVRMVARAARIPAFQRYLYTLKAWADAGFRQAMRDNGVAVESVVHSVSRFGEETFGHGIPSQLANTLFKVSGLNFIDSVRRTATGAMLMRKFGDLVSQHATMDDLHPLDKQLLESRGVDGSTWNIWKQAQLSEGLLTPNAIAQIQGLAPGEQRNAMQQLVGAVAMDEGTVVPLMKDWSRATVQGKLGSPKRGTIGGEIMSSLLQFKSFPIAMISNHWQRMMAQPTPAGKVAYAAELIASSLVLGALSVQLKSLASGHDPQDMGDAKFAARAAIQGGAFGLYGDLLGQLFVSPYRETLTDNLGPIASEMGDLWKLGRSAWEAHLDPNKIDQFGGEATRFAKGMTPFANLWYTRAITDHLIFQRLQDYFSPGYNQRSDERTQKFYGSGAWWPTSSGAAPSELLSSKGIMTPRAPRYGENP